jgi:multiple sugar transport system ATP-binding protein
MAARLRFVDVGKWFGKTRVLEGLNLEVKEGELFVLLGPSGCGKSTLLRMTAGLETLSHGEIYLNDRPISRVPSEDRNIAMVFQDYALYPHMTVYQNMAFGLRRHGVSRSETDERVRKTCETLGIGHLLDRRPHQLSGGQQQRVALGRAIVRDPVLYLLDEPLSNLDAQVRATVRAEIKHLQKSLGVTSIYVTHDQTEAMTLAGRMAVLNDGIIQQVGAPLDVYRAPAKEFVARFLSSPRLNEVDGTVAHADGVLTISSSLGTFRCPLAAVEAAASMPAVRLGFRPEDLKVSLVPIDGQAPLPVRLIEALGSEALVHVQVGNEDLVIRVAAETVDTTPERVWVRPPGSTVHLFDPRTGEAVGHFVST